MEQREFVIPLGSMQRLTAVMRQFEELAGVIAEAMGIPQEQQRTLNMERGVFVVGSTPAPVPNGQVAEEAPAF